MRLRSKQTSEISQEIGGLDNGKNNAKPSQNAQFHTFFFQKITIFLEKRKTLINFLF